MSLRRVYSTTEIINQVTSQIATLGAVVNILKGCQKVEQEYRAQGRYESDLATAVLARYEDAKGLLQQVSSELLTEPYNNMTYFQYVIKPGRPIDWETASLSNATPSVISGAGTKEVFEGIDVYDVVEISGLTADGDEGMEVVTGNVDDTSLTLTNQLTADADSSTIQVKLIRKYYT